MPPTASISSPANSTIVRTIYLAMRQATRTYFALTSRLQPGLARRQAARLFTTPPQPGRRFPAPAPARRDTILTPVGHVAVWQAGPATAPAVLLVHGWGGRGAQLGGFVAPLMERGFRVVWYDQPGHGDSDGRRVALPDLVRALRAVDTACGPFHAAIGHSLGGAAVALALRDGLTLARAVLLGAPASISEYMQGFARHLGLSAAVREAVRRQIEARHGQRFADIDRIEDLARLPLPSLLVHDAGDRHVPFAHARRIAAHLPSARVVRTHGLGHFRLLGDRSVQTLAARFVAGDATSLPDDLPALPAPAPIY